MEIWQSDVPGLKTIKPKPLSDTRGWFMRTFCSEMHGQAGIIASSFIQENQSRSRKGTIRGLHTRAELRESKLVRVPQGRIFDVVVDLRPKSPTFLQWRSFILDDEDHLQLLIPAGCAHGFQALSDQANVCYKVDAPYTPSLDVAIAWDDPDLGIQWPLSEQIISTRDRSAPKLADMEGNFYSWFGGFSPDAN